MLTLHRDLVRTVIDGDTELDIRHARSLLDLPLSYRVVGSEFSPLVRSHVWDGRKRLLRKWKGSRLTCPSGLHDIVERTLLIHGAKFRVVDQRVRPDYIGKTRWAGHEPYAHQWSAAVAGLEAGGGILRLPIRSGKTELAAWMTRHIGRRTLFVVPSEHLLTQTLRAFRTALPDVSVTGLGCGHEDDSGDVVVASIQTIVARGVDQKGKGQQNQPGHKVFWKPWFRSFSRAFDVLFLDEGHHLDGGGGDAWREAAMSFEAAYRFLLSATVPKTDREMQTGESLWLRAICGPLVYSVELSELIETGILVRPRVVFQPYETPKITGSWSQSTYTKAIVECSPRNELLIGEAVRYAREGRAVLVDCSRVAHARALHHAIAARLPPATTALLTGASGRKARDDAVEQTQNGKVSVIVATIFGEGIDIPRLSVVVNAEGGQGDVGTIQRLRNLTPCEGKTDAIVVEPNDQHHRTLTSWTASRARIYAAESAFVLEGVKNILRKRSAAR